MYNICEAQSKEAKDKKHLEIVDARTNKFKILAKESSFIFCQGKIYIFERMSHDLRISLEFSVKWKRQDKTAPFVKRY